MALRDRIEATLDSSVPAKERKQEVVVTSPGGRVDMEAFGDTHIKLVERTRRGKEKSALVLHRDSVIMVRFINAK